MKENLFQYFPDDFGLATSWLWGDRCYITAHHQGRRYVWIHIHSILSWSKDQTSRRGKGSVCQPALFSGFETSGGGII